MPYEPGTPDVDGCYGVYFPVQEAIGAHTYDPSQTPEIVFTVARTNTVGDITVPVTYKESHEGIFEVGEVKFADGQTETSLKVTFPKSANGVNYSLSLAIEDPQYASKYLAGATNVDFSVLRVEWKDFLNPATGKPAVVTFNEGWWDEVHTATVKYYEVDGVRTCVATCNEVAEDGTPLGIWGDNQGVTFNFTWYTSLYNEDGKQVIDVPRQYFGFDYADWTSKPESEAVNPLYFYDWFHYLTTDGGYAGAWPDWAGFLAKNPGVYAQSYYDGNGGFYFNLRYQVPALGGGFTPDEFDVVAIADGFVRVDYSLSAEADYTVEGVAPIEFEAGLDITKIQYVVVEGEANSVVANEQVSAIVAGTAKNVLTIAADEMYLDEEAAKFYATAEVTCPKTGVYTVVAVGFDAESTAMAATSVVFDYVAADDNTYDVEFVVETAATPARYADEGYDEYNSFSFLVYGGNKLTDVKLSVFKTADVEKKGLDAIVASLRTETDKVNYSVSADTLALVNTTAGYADVVGGLADGTSYTVVVWGTNGMQTKVVTSTYETTKNPEVFKSLGKATYTDDLFLTFYTGGEYPAITYDVEIEESQDNPGKYRLVNPYGEVYPYNEPGDYDPDNDYYLTINAVNPKKVYIETTSLGLNWGYGEVTASSYAGYLLEKGKTVEEIEAMGDFFGTLVDGVITFPKNSLLVAMANVNGGNFFETNATGEFKVVLPSKTAAGDTTTGGTTTSSVNKSSFINKANVVELPMSVGHFAGLEIEREVKTVEVSAKLKAAPVQKTSNRTLAPSNYVELR